VNIAHYAIVAAVALGVTLGITPLVRTAGIRWGIVSHPGGRHVHSGVVPRIGGLAMFAGVAAGLLTQYLGERFWGFDDVLAKIGRPVPEASATASRSRLQTRGTSTTVCWGVDSTSVRRY
jgi:hypothetical protein